MRASAAQRRRREREEDDAEAVHDDGRRRTEHRSSARSRRAPARHAEMPPAEVRQRISWAVRPSRPAPAPVEGGVVAFVWRLFVALMLLGWVLNLAWPMPAREQAAGSIVQSFCAARPQPQECRPEGHPSDFFKRLLELFG